MREDLLKEIEAEYAAQRAENERTEAARRAEIREKHPAVERLIRQRLDLIQRRIRTLAGTGKPSGTDGQPLPEKIAELNREIREGLKAAGLPEDYLDPVYRCARCRDTGYTGVPVREPCACLTEAYQQKLRKTIGLAGGREETFETFNLSIIPDEKENGQLYSQRDISRKACGLCEKWADNYPRTGFHTIVLSGESGLGKTFLMHAMAHRLLERGFSVLTISAFQFLQTARKSCFENDGGLDELIGAPVLMLDDVGSEPLMKSITVEALFNLINERQNRSLPTVLSTNLNMEEFRERYTERICSRITDPRNSLVIALKGKDLRKAGART